MNVSRRNLLIYGFIREFEKNHSLSNIIPSGVTNIIEISYPLQFTFNEYLHGGITLSDDKLKLITGSSYYTITFGEFLHKSDRVNMEIIMHLEDAIPGNTGIGFITSEYKVRTEHSIS